MSDTDRLCKSAPDAGYPLQIGADVVELVGVGFLGQRHSVVKRLDAFLDVFRRVLEVEHEGILLARRGAVQAGERFPTAICADTP